MARQFRRRTFPQSQRRKTDWFGGVSTTFDVNALASGVAAIISSIDTRVGLTPFAPYTITRVRGLLTIGTQATTAGLNPHGAFGICVVNGEAFDAGVASVPTPFSESFDDRWLYHMYFAVMQQGGGASTRSEYASYEIDSKGQRKVDTGDVVLFMIENGSSVDSLQFIFNARTLLKLF